MREEERIADGRSKGRRETEALWAESGNEKWLCKDIMGEKCDITMEL